MMKYSRCPGAVAKIRGDAAHPQLHGTVSFYQRRDGVLVEAYLQGLPKTATGFFGFHIHEGGCCEGDGFPDVGSHYDLYGMPHPKHTGDLPPLLSDHGKAYMAAFSSRFHIGEIIGRTVIIHGGPDDLTTQPAGNAGEKIACGTIKRIRK